ncbi:fibrous sheath CABYR-binding protein isoform X2 [Anabas testudineus]|uniref:fibrous sheath CABYR-binding protein isoform X2 n=1 Tax=Anabas testudineus TaxID=64144 RepID=UPI000E455B1C|nr:fibrous sheath CABYR-binding protein isoform X2 [Anabas testudineus]
MSKGDDRDQVFQTTRVRTALKNDGSWIHNSKQDNEDKPRKESAAGASCIVKNKSYVFSAAKKFESTASPQNSPLQKTQFAPSKGSSAKQANVKALAEEIDKNTGTQQKAPLRQSNVECNKDKVSEDAHVEDPVAGTPALTGTGENIDPAEVPARVAVELKPQKTENATDLNHAEVNSMPQPAKESCKTCPSKQVATETVEAEAKAVVDSSAETPAVVNATPGEKTAVQHLVERVPDTVSKSSTQSADVNMKEPVAETAAAVGAGKSKDQAEVPAQNAVQLNPKAEPPAVTEPENATNLNHAEVNSMPQPAKESCKTCPPKQVATETVEAEAKAVVDSSAETPAVVNATPEDKAVVQHLVERVPDTVSKSSTQSADVNMKEPVAETAAAVGAGKSKDQAEVPAQNAVQLNPKAEPPAVMEPKNATNLNHAEVKSMPQPAKESCKTCPPKQVATETVEAEAKAVVDSSAETPAVVNATPEDKAVVQHLVERVPDTVSKSSTQSADVNMKEPVAETAAAAGAGKSKDHADVPAQNAVQLNPKAEPPAVMEPKNATNLNHAEVKSMPQPAKESCKTCPPKQVGTETVEAGAKAVVDSSAETPAVVNATPDDKAVVQHLVERVPDTVSKSSTQSADVNMKESVAETAAAVGAEKSKDHADVPAQNAVQLNPKAEPPAVMEPKNATNLNHAEEKSMPQPAKESCKTCPPKQVATETVEAEAKAVVDSSAETPAVVNATPEDKAVVQHLVERVPDTVSKSSTQSADVNVKEPVAETAAAVGAEKSKDHADVPAQNAVQLNPIAEPPAVTEPENVKNLNHAEVKSMPQPAKESCKTCPPKQVATETVEAEAKAVVDSSAETPAVVNATPGEKSAVQHLVERVPDTVSKSSTQSADVHVKEPVAETAAAAGAGKSKDHAEVPAQNAVQLNPKAEPPAVMEPENATNLNHAEVKSMPQPAKACPPKQVATETVEAEAKAVVDSSAETPAINATPGEKAVVQHLVERVPDNDSSTQSAAEIAIKSTESKVKSGATAEPVVKTKAEEVVECVQPVENTLVKQSMDPVPESAAHCVMELNIEDAVQDKFSDRAIELTDALDVVPPTAEAVTKPVNDPKQTHSEMSNLNQSDHTNNSEQFQKPSEELQSTHTLKKTRNGKAVCSFCDQIIDGNVKITISEPPMTCHDTCFKCGVCAKALGDLLTPMFLHHQVIHCNGCFAKALKT